MKTIAVSAPVSSARKTMRNWSVIWNKSGERLLTTQYDYLDTVGEIVDTMAKVAIGKEKLFFKHSEGKRVVAKATVLGGRVLNCLKVDLQLLAHQLPQHRVSPLFTIFKRYASSVWHGNRVLNLGTVDVLNQMVDKLRALAKGEAVTRRLGNLKRAERENARRVKDLLAQLRRSGGSKLLVLRLDLEYYSVWGPRNAFEGQEISFEEATEHRDRFLEYLRKGPFSEHLKAYIWKLEYGLEKGYHFHWAIFLDGQKVREDITIGDLMGEHWKSAVTDGKGMFFNVNRKKGDFTEPGIGMLARGDDTMWKAAGKALRYLTKVDLYVRFLAPDRSRTFGAGGVYKPVKPRR